MGLLGVLWWVAADHCFNRDRVAVPGFNAGGSISIPKSLRPLWGKGYEMPSISGLTSPSKAPHPINAHLISALHPFNRPDVNSSMNLTIFPGSLTWGFPAEGDLKSVLRSSD